MITRLRRVWAVDGNTTKSQPEKPKSQALEKPGRGRTVEVDLQPEDPLYSLFLEASGVVEIDRINVDSPALEALKEAGVKIAVPLVNQGELIGVLNLGNRLSEQDYSTEDRCLLYTLATQAAPALRVAQLARQHINESFPSRPVAAYGRSKVLCEELVRSSGVPYTIVQPAITYGPGDTNGMMDKILRMVARYCFVMPGSGSSRVQLVYIDDVARLTLAAALSPRTLGQRFICTYRDPIRVRELIALSAKTVGTYIPPLGPPVRLLQGAAVALEWLARRGGISGEPPLRPPRTWPPSRWTGPTTSRACARSLLEDEPQIGYADGIRRTAEAMGLAR